MLSWSLLAAAALLVPVRSGQEDTPVHLDIAEVVVDADGDLVVDRDGQVVRFRGWLTTDAYTAVRPDQIRAYVEDATGGVRIIASERDVFRRVRVGDEVLVEGRIHQFRGMPAVEISLLLNLGRREQLEPRTIGLGEIGEELCGRFVKVRGEIVDPPMDDVHRFWIRDETGSVRLFLRRAVYEDRELPRFSMGDELEVVGIIEQFDGSAPASEGYRLTPRLASDVVLAADRRGLYVAASLAAVALISVALVASFIARRHRRRTRSEGGPSNERNLPRSDRLQSLGTLASGIAHDFNNYLLAIGGFTELALDELPKSSSCRPNLEQVLLTTEQAKRMVEEILAFSRQKEDTFEWLWAREVVEESLRLLRVALPSSVGLRTELGDEVGKVHVNKAQIHQLVLNLGSNAADAMGGDGQILVVLERAELDEGAASRLGLVGAGSYAVLAFRDTGVGMDGETIERIYDPFFTTKEIGKGTGLGLSVVHAIVQRHSGALRVESQPGSGTTFRCYLASSDREILSESPREVIPAPGSGRILLVEDDPKLNDLSRRQIERLGYEVTTSCDGVDAFERFDSAPREFDVVVTDYAMPAMTGLELAKKVKVRRSAVRVLLVTGHGEAIQDCDPSESGVDMVLAKPFRRSELANALQALMG